MVVVCDSHALAFCPTALEQLRYYLAILDENMDPEEKVSLLRCKINLLLDWEKTLLVD